MSLINELPPQRLDVEADTLGQRQFVGVVDGVGRPPHVELPGIAARFAPAPGFLFAAKRAADFRRRWCQYSR